MFKLRGIFSTAASTVAIVLALGSAATPAHAQESAGFNLVFPALHETTSESPVVILVPGFFNTILPGDFDPANGYIPYFSKSIVDAIRARATVIVVDTLIPTGTIEANGVLLERFLAATVDRFPGRKMIIVAHSAGGLYLMRALTNRPSLPIKTVLTLATPYTGVEFVDNLAANIPGLDSLAHYLNLDSIREFRASRMSEVLSRFSVPDHIRWITISGEQPPCFLLSCGKARYLSWLLTITQHLMSSPSDGIVTVESAMGGRASIAGHSGAAFHMEAWSDYNVGLEHSEMVQDYRLFKVFGVLDAGYIRDRQAQYMNEILDRLGAVELTSAGH